MRRAWLSLGLALALQLTPACAEPPAAVMVYVVAHPDDWQLFMNPRAWHDVQAGARHKVVFVYLTAGDAGQVEDAAAPEARSPYALAREQGADHAVRFTADGAGRGSGPMVEERVTLAGASLLRRTYRNTVSYYFRLPDGDRGGGGFPATGTWSLKRFLAGTAGPAETIDGSARYETPARLTETLRALIAREAADIPVRWLNVSEIDKRRNPGSHSDHIAAARLALAATATLPCFSRAHYSDYVNAQRPTNLLPADRDIHAAVFAVTAAALAKHGLESGWDPIHRAWLGRQFVRIEPVEGGCEPPPTSTAAAE